jgi:twinkle protein
VAGKGGQHLETLHDLLADQGIELHEIPRPGGKDHGGLRSKIYCPDCNGGRQKERNFFVKIDPDGQGFRFFCHRASCGVCGGRRLPGAGTLDQAAWTPKVYRRPRPPEEVQRPDTLLAYYEKFGISAATIQALGIYRTERRMPVFTKGGEEIKDETLLRPVIAYPYREDGELLNVKYKAVYGNGIKRFSQEPEAEQSLYNIDAFLSDDYGIVVEGEDDVAAVFEAGYRQVTTLVDGSPSKLAETYDPANDTDRRYMALGTTEKLRKLKRIILAGDMDPAGVRHHEEISRRLGKERCWLVRWPDGCKDAKDTLTKRGRDAVRFAIDNAARYPIKELPPLEETDGRDLYNGVGHGRYLTGILAIDQRVALSQQGRFYVTTGYPGDGKSTFWLAMANLYVENAEEQMQVNQLARPFHVVLFSGEVRNIRVAADLISQHAKMPFFPHAVLERMPVELAAKLLHEWINRNFTFIAWPKRGEQPALSWLIDITRMAVRRTGAQLVIWDPWQEIDDEMPQTWRKTHSEWIGKCLQQVVGLTDELKTNIVLITHPSKPKDKRKDGSFGVPDGHDIGGSQNFFSRCDVGLTIARPSIDNTDMLVHCWKAKESGWYGLRGDTILRFDPGTMRIYPKPVEVDALGEPVRHWADMERDSEAY